MSRLLLSVLGGLSLALLFTASPLGISVLACAPLVGLVAARRLDRDDRRVLLTVLGVALVTRLAAILGLFVLGLTDANNLAMGSLTGDQAYNVSRALRARDILRGAANLTLYDYFVATDEYGRTSYIGLLTLLQFLFGPAPFALRVLNALLFITGAALLFRAVRPRYGLLPATLGLVVVLFLPSLFYASISVLKEPLYFLASSSCLVAAIAIGRSPRPLHVAGLIGALAISVWIVDDLRRGAVVLALSGLACGIGIRLIGMTKRPLVTVAALAVAGAVIVATVEPIRNTAVRGITSAAIQHTGHVFTQGHAYRLLEDGFYANPVTPAGSQMRLTMPQALRFVMRGLAAFILTPLPWEAISLSERVYLPEHLLWYVLLLMLPFGVAAGWTRDPWVTSMLLGFVLPTAAVLALTNGNIGTLLRLRGLVTPYLAWISVLGFCAVAEWCCAAWRARTAAVIDPRAAEGRA